MKSDRVMVYAGRAGRARAIKARGGQVSENEMSDKSLTLAGSDPADTTAIQTAQTGEEWRQA